MEFLIIYQKYFRLNWLYSNYLNALGRRQKMPWGPWARRGIIYLCCLQWCCSPRLLSVFIYLLHSFKHFSRAAPTKSGRSGRELKSRLRSYTSSPASQFFFTTLCDGRHQHSLALLLIYFFLSLFILISLSVSLRHKMIHL